MRQRDRGAGEVCDDGNTASGDGCASSCRSDETCGNGVVDVATNEGCGCGTDEAAAGCNQPNSTAPGAECLPTCVLHHCGDGIIEGSEECEPDVTPLGSDCTAFGYYDPDGLGCGDDCRFAVDGCARRATAISRSPSRVLRCAACAHGAS